MRTKHPLTTEPYWLSRTEIDSIEAHLKSIDLTQHPELKSIREEIAVAHTRSETNKSIPALTAVLGYTIGTIPVYLDTVEVAQLRNIETLSDQVRSKLA